MAEEKRQPQSTVAVQTPPQKTPVQPKPLPPWRVLLHNDPINDMLHVVETICMLTSLGHQAAVQRMLEAHTKGVTLLLTTHKERAELYQEQFTSRGLTTSIEPAE